MNFEKIGKLYLCMSLFTGIPILASHIAYANYKYIKEMKKESSPLSSFGDYMFCNFNSYLIGNGRGILYGLVWPVTYYHIANSFYNKKLHRLRRFYDMDYITCYDYNDIYYTKEDSNK